MRGLDAIYYLLDGEGSRDAELYDNKAGHSTTLASVTAEPPLTPPPAAVAASEAPSTTSGGGRAVSAEPLVTSSPGLRLPAAAAQVVGQVWRLVPTSDGFVMADDYGESFSDDIDDDCGGGGSLALSQLLLVESTLRPAALAVVSQKVAGTGGEEVAWISESPGVSSNQQYRDVSARRGGGDTASQRVWISSGPDGEPALCCKNDDGLYELAGDESGDRVASISECPEVSSDTKNRDVSAECGVGLAASQLLLVGDGPEPAPLSTDTRVVVNVLRSGPLSRDGLRASYADYDESMHDVSDDEGRGQVAVVSDSLIVRSAEMIGDASAENGGGAAVSLRFSGSSSSGPAPPAADEFDVIELSDSSVSDESIGEIGASLGRQYIPCEQRERLPSGRWDVFELEPAAWRDAVDKMSSDGPLKREFARWFHIPITRRNLRTLNPGEELDDEVCNLYFELIMERNRIRCDLPKVFIFNTHFLQQHKDKGYEHVKKWTKKFDLFALDMVLFPVNVAAKHWSLVSVDFCERSMLYYDSLRWQGADYLLQVNKYLNEEHRAKSGISHNFGGWEIGPAPRVPRQQGSLDCGVFMCRIADCLAAGRPLNFTQADMSFFRDRIAVEILGGELLK